jgi:polyphosphate kinase
VLAVKMTLYRTDTASPLVESLIEAARNGKEVTAVVELRARFDEAQNIDLATRLQDAGANVAYGIVGYKTHAKMLMVVRREGRELKRYVHLGTGNYHPGTARTYTDFSLMTSAPEMGEDVHRIFLQLTGLAKVTELEGLLQSPFTLHEGLLGLIEDEIEHAQNGSPARIAAKMNALTEPEIIRALYRASQAGVRVDLIVRGICCLRPGVPGVSENISVRSIVGRFLEHSRIAYFHAGGPTRCSCSSADWMERNLHRRIRDVLPVTDPCCRDHPARRPRDLPQGRRPGLEPRRGRPLRAQRPSEAEPHSARHPAPAPLGPRRPQTGSRRRARRRTRPQGRLTSGAARRASLREAQLEGASPAATENGVRLVAPRPRFRQKATRSSTHSLSPMSR